MTGATASNALSGETEAIVLVKAAPQVGDRHGETVCCAAVDLYGKWLRLYPVSFRHLEPGRRFGRWDRIRFKWRTPADDRRIESRRIEQQTLNIVGKLKESERASFLGNAVVTSLDQERQAGRSLALLRPEIKRFWHEEKTDEEIGQERTKFAKLRQQQELFGAADVVPYDPCPLRFKYSYRTDDGDREGTCQDWETEATYFRWVKEYGQTATLEKMYQIFGRDYPAKGMCLAMGTHSRFPDRWLINGIVRLDIAAQSSLI